MNNLGMIFQAAKNPQQFIQQMMGNNQVMSNPMAKNAIEMLQKGDNKGIEEMARNLCKERNIQPEEAMNMAKSFFGM